MIRGEILKKNSNKILPSKKSFTDFSIMLLATASTQKRHDE